MLQKDRNYIKTTVIDLINENANTSRLQINESYQINQCIEDSIEFVKILIKIEEIFDIEFVPEELKLDKINTVSELIDLIERKLTIE